MTITDAQRIRVIRALIGLPSGALAARLGVCAGTITAWEHGRAAPQGESKQALSELCQENGIAFLPSGMPVPFSDVLLYKPEEIHNGQ